MANKYVYITGAAGGIGKTLIETFASHGINLVVQDLRSSEVFSEYLNTIKNKYGVEIHESYYDITDYSSVKSGIMEIFKKGIKINYLINCAGIAHGGFFQTTSIDTIKKVFDINLFGTMNVTQNVLKLMRNVENPSIVNICSITGYDLNEGNSGYGVSKAAEIAWTKMLSKELAHQGIRVNGVAPGLTDTNMAKQMEDKAGQEMIHASLMDRLGKPQEIANVIYFLTSPEASFVNGEVIRVDGGSR